MPTTVPQGTAAPPGPTCIKGTIPPGQRPDPSIVRLPTVTLTLASSKVEAGLGIDIANRLCVPLSTVVFGSGGPRNINGQWQYNVSIVCEQHDGCDSEERMEYLVYLLTLDGSVRTELGVTAATQDEDPSHNLAPTDAATADDDSLVKKTAFIVLIIVAGIAVVIVMVVAAIRYVRRKKRLNAYRNHLDFSPDGMSPESVGRADVDDLPNDPVAGVALELEDIEPEIEVVDKPIKH